MADNSNTGVPEDEKETNDLLALLYSEDGFDDLDSELVSDDELGGMQSLRSLFKDLPDEEPSDAVSNKLMALAAQHAPKPVTESRGFFAWFSDTFMPVMTHPGMAAAATLVLVVGVAGTLYVKGEAKMAQPNVESRAEAPSDSPASSLAPSSSAPTGPGSSAPEATAATKELNLNQDSFDGVAAEGTETSSIATERNKSKEAAQDGEKREAPSEDPAAIGDGSRGALGGLLKDSEAEFKSSSATGSKNRGASTRDSSLSDRIGEVSTGSAKGFGGGGDSAGRRVKDIVDAPPPASAPAPSPEPAPVVTTDSAPARKAAPKPKLVKKKPSSRPSSPPPPPRTAADSGEDDDLDEEEAEQSKADKKQSASESVRLHNLAIAAAKREDCTRVVSLGNQIRKIDSAYYDRTFLSDSRLTECRKRVNSKTSK